MLLSSGKKKQHKYFISPTQNLFLFQVIILNDTCISIEQVPKKKIKTQNFIIKQMKLRDGGMGDGVHNIVYELNKMFWVFIFYVQKIWNFISNFIHENSKEF